MRLLGLSTLHIADLGHLFILLSATVAPLAWLALAFLLLIAHLDIGIGIATIRRIRLNLSWLLLLARLMTYFIDV